LAKLIDSGCEVVFWCRGETLKAIRSEGLRVSNGGESAVVRPTLATCDASEAGKADLLIFATKGYHLEAAAKETAPLATEKTVAIPLLNGVSAASVLEKHLPGSDVLEGCIYVSAHTEAPGTVRQAGSVLRVLFGKRGIGEAENRRRYGDLERTLQQSGLNITLTDRIDVEVWSKFLFLSPFAGVTTLTGRSISEVLDDAESAGTVTRMIREAEALAGAKGIALPENIESLTLEKARAFPPLTKTSMQVDREKGKATDLEFLIGYVCGEARALNIPTPAYDAVYSALRG
jgi:2-dehydropantoate 2-reductase